MFDESVVRKNLDRVRERIAAAGGSGVRVIGVTKSLSADAWRVATVVGCDGIGENYAQEVVVKGAEVRDHAPLHFIGQLQTNKVRTLSGLVDVWQTVDRESLIREIVKRAPSGSTPVIFLQVNTTGESQKAGCDPGDAQRLVDLARSLGCQVDGAMTIGPTEVSSEGSRTAFGLLRRIADDNGLRERSMGMSGDLEVAVEEGSTMVRIGTALFGQRP